MTDLSSHGDAGASLGNNLPFESFAVEPRIGDPLVVYDSVQGKKFDDHRKLVDKQVIVCESIYENVIQNFVYDKPDKWGFERVLPSPDYSHLVPQVESTILKKRKYIEVFHEDGTFSHSEPKERFFHKDLVTSETLSYDYNDLPPIVWLYPTDQAALLALGVVLPFVIKSRVLRYRFLALDVETGELRDVPRSYCSPYEPFPMSSLRWVDFEKRAKNLDACAGKLNFVQVLTAKKETTMRLKSVEFCRQRLCPMCMWRRSLFWYSRFLDRFTAITQAFSKYRLLHLVLTVPNVHISNLRSTLQRMNRAWNRMMDLKCTKPIFPESKIIKGFLKSTEVTREYDWVKYTELVDGKEVKKKYAKGMGRQGYVHPHFHILLAVPSSYKDHGYITKQRWMEGWREAMKMPEIMSIDIHQVLGGKQFGDMDLGSIEDFKNAVLKRDTLFSALPELVKYTTKPSEFSMPFEKSWETQDQRDQFYYAFERQVKHSRFISTGGIFKDILADDDKTDDVSNQDMINVGSHLKEGDEELPDSLDFDWAKERGHFFLSWINYETDYEG